MTQQDLRAAKGIVDGLFEKHAARFGDDLSRYRAHVHRVLGLVALQTEIGPGLARPLGIAAFYHDAGIWFDGTWDYLPPSIERALTELGSSNPEQRSLVEALIDEHHRIRKARHPHPLVEAFRRADLADVSYVVPTPGVRRRDYKALVAEYPFRGFRRMLVGAFLRGLRENPARPLPMFKL